MGVRWTTCVSQYGDEIIPWRVSTLCCPLYSLMPYTSYDAPPRSILGAIQFTQAITTERTTHNMTALANDTAPYASNTTADGIRVSDHYQTTDSGLPGVLVRVLYHCHPFNHEDAVVVNCKSVDTGIFDITSEPVYGMDAGNRVPEVGEVMLQLQTPARW